LGAPATPDALAALERQTELPLPTQLRELLLEANGARDDSDSPRQIAAADAILDLTRAARQASANYESPPALEHVLFFADPGNGDYLGICAKPLGNLPAGAIVLFDHETGTLEKIAKDLHAWITKKT
jgi:hypothetical protein